MTKAAALRTEFISAKTTYKLFARRAARGEDVSEQVKQLEEHLERFNKIKAR